MEGKGRKGEKGKIDGRCRAKFGWSGFLGVTHLLHPLRLFFFALIYCTSLVFASVACGLTSRVSLDGDIAGEESRLCALYRIANSRTT